MTRRKALTVVSSVIGVSGLMFAFLLISTPVPAVSHASYSSKSGCHCSSPPKVVKPTTTTAKSTMTTAKAGLALGAAAAALTDPGSGGPSDGTGGTNVSGDGSQEPGASDASAAAGDNADGSQVNAMAGGPPRYYLSPVAIAILLVYGVSFTLYRTKRLRVATHRKIWNVMLLATFLLCGLLGLVLAVGVTRNPPLELPTWLLVWHVETGIAMCFISLFHVGWHLKYYVAMVTGKRRNERTRGAPAVEKQRAARPKARRPLIPRTDAERMLAFQRRRVTRTGSRQAVHGGRPVWTDLLAG
jgi:hypothetical protein